MIEKTLKVLAILSINLLSNVRIFLIVSKLVLKIFQVAFDINNLTECEKGMNSTMKKLCCDMLMEKLQYTSPDTCCIYPRLVIWKWQFNLCREKCNLPYNFTQEEYVEKGCCHLTCCMKYAKIIAENPLIDGVDSEGLKFSFLLSVS